MHLLLKRSALCALIFFITESFASSSICDQLTESKKALNTIINNFSFPKEWDLPTSDPALRRSIYKAFGGRDIYTGQPLEFSEMHIDHIIPEAEGGPSNVFNFVPTSSRINSRKNAKFDAQALVPMLFLVRSVYAPDVIRLLTEERKPKREKKSAIPTRKLPRSTIQRENRFSHSSIRGFDIRPADEQTLKAVLSFKRIIEAHPEFNNGNEVLIPPYIATNLQPEDFASYTGRFIFRNKKQVNDSELDSYRDPELVFSTVLKDRNGFYLRVNSPFSKVIFTTSLAEFTRLLRNLKMLWMTGQEATTS